MKSGDSFGKVALLYNAPRDDSAKAIEKCGFWAIERSKFKEIVKELIQKNF